MPTLASSSAVHSVWLCQAEIRTAVVRSFFISFLPTYNLNGEYTAFGRIVSGIDVLGCITKHDPDAKKEEGAIPPRLDEIIEAKVIRKRNHEYKPNKSPPPTEAQLQEQQLRMQQQQMQRQQ